MKWHGRTKDAAVHVPVPIILITILTMAVIVVAAAILTPWETLVAAVFTASGLPIYYIFVRPIGPFKKLSPIIKVQYVKFAKFMQHILQIIPEDKSD